MAREARAPRARPRGPRHWGVCFRASRFSTTAKRKKKKRKDKTHWSRRQVCIRSSGSTPFASFRSLPHGSHGAPGRARSGPVG
jgi:hypothetical protein